MEGPRRVERALRALGVTGDVIALPDRAATAQEAAALLGGVPLGCVVKSLLFRVDGVPTLVLVAGDRRVVPQKLKEALGARRVIIVAPGEVERLCGFPVGAVSPWGSDPPLPTVVDASLGRFDIVYTAGGAVDRLVAVRFADLVRSTGALVVNCTEAADRV